MKCCSVKQKLTLAVIVFFIYACFIGCGEVGQSTSDNTEVSLNDLNNAEHTIAVEIGTMESEVKQYLPNAQYIYIDSVTEGILAVKSERVDAYVCDEAAFKSLLRSGLEELTVLDKKFNDTSHIAVGISPKSEIDNVEVFINQFISDMQQQGILEQMYKRWITDGNYKMPDIEVPASPEHTIKIGTTGLLEPYTFYEDTELTGYDIELIKRFALWANAKVEISTYDWAGIAPACATGKIDYVMSSLFDIPERRESIGFSIPYVDVNAVCVVNEKKISTVDNVTTPRFSSISDFNNMTMGSQTGTMFDKIVDSAVSDVTHKYYDDISGQMLALRNKDVDAIGLDEPVAVLATAKNKGFAVFSEIVQTDTYGLAMPKNGEMTKDVSTVIEKFTSDGTLEKLKEKWFSGNMETMKIDMAQYNSYDVSNGTIRYVHDSTQIPMSYVNDDGSSAGYEVELVLMIGKELGKKIEITQANFSALITAVSSGKADIASGCISITDERRENVDFPTTHYKGGIVLLCRTEDVAASSNINGSSNGKITSVSDLEGKNIGILIGSIYDEVTPKYIKNVSILYYNSVSDMIQGLKTKKIDGFLYDLPAIKSASNADKEITYLSEALENDNYAYIFQKTDNGNKLCSQMNEFLKKLKDDGTLKEIDEIWLGTDESKKTVIDISSLTAENGILHYATTSSSTPFNYISNNQMIGYDIDIITRFCKEYGYGLEIDDMDFSGIISSVSTGKADLAGAGISITEERKESVSFSEPNYEGGVVLAIRKADSVSEILETQNESFFSSIEESFNKTFIRENRWQLVVSGLEITLLISVFAAFFGTIFGFFVCLIRRGKNRFFAGLAAAFIRIIQGIPLVVLLMVLYYVVFVSANIDGIVVAVIAFAMNFGVNVSEIMRSGIDAVDKGQWEAASALGFGKVKTFSKVILPQAVRHVLPSYKGEFINMMKMTSVVGYIAIQDLTKASDIIRSRTYEAFFPLIATALIYFLLAWILTLFIGLIEIKIDPKRRSRNPKGVNIALPSENIVETVNSNSEKGKIINIEHLKKVYPNVIPLADVNAVINRGDVVTVIGPSGTGKSTLLRCLNRLEIPTDGDITVFGMNTGAKKTDISIVRQRMGMVFQNFNLFPHLTIVENIMLAPTQLKNKPRQIAYESAMDLLHDVGLSEKALSYPDELSGGQKQRAAIARTLAMQPEIILFDEPTSALDPTMVGEVLAVIRRLASQGLTMIIVTHEMKFAKDVSTRVFYMDEGIIYEQGTPTEVFDNPQRNKTRAFVKRLKVLEQKITSPDYDFIALNEALSSFGLKHLMTAKQIMNMQRLFEELIAQNTLPRLGKAFELTVIAEYNEEAGTLEMRFIWKGEKYNPLDEGDELTLMLVRPIIKISKYEYENGVNKLYVTL